VFVLKARDRSEHPVDIGVRSEVSLVNAFVQLGYAVFLPVGHNHRCDLVLETDGGLLRVQCKTGRLRRGTIQFNTVSTRSNRHAVRRRGYGDDVDAFAIWCPRNGKAYMVPVADLATGMATLRVESPRNGQKRGVRWAADYELPPFGAEEPRTGFEPATPALQERCSTN
jgi:hypothetical protein